MSDHARIKELESALTALREEREQLQRDAESHLTRANEEIALRERTQIAYSQSEQKRLALIDQLAHLTEERNHWKRRAEDAEGRIANATA